MLIKFILPLSPNQSNKGNSLLDYPTQLVETTFILLLTNYLFLFVWFGDILEIEYFKETRVELWVYGLPITVTSLLPIV